MPKISIIIPLYNNKNYIEKCINSILKQTYTNYEVLIINDGSTDGSETICTKYLKFPNVHLFNKKNEGVAVARNFGIDKCSDDSIFITFIDSDDYIEPNFLSTLILHPADLTMCNVNHIYLNKKCQVNNLQSHTYSNFKNNAEFAKLLSTGLLNPIWNKLYSKKIITQNNLRFNDIYAEDIDFNINYLNYCNTISLVGVPLYNYCHHNNTLTSRTSIELYNNYLTLHQKLIELFDKSLTKYIDQFIYHQYIAISLKFIKQDQYDIVHKFHNEILIKQAIKSHKSASFGDLIFNTLIKLKQFKLIKSIFISNGK